MSEAAVPLPVEPGRGEQRPRWQADLMLVVAAFFFGSTFLVVQDAVADVDVVPFLGVRFMIAAVVLAPIALRRAGSAGELRDGIFAGSTLLAGYVLQTVGLQHTSAATSAFITYMLVVFVPLIGFVTVGRRLHPITFVSLAIAVVGLALLTGGGDTGFGVGELLTLGCAVCFAAHIIVLGEVALRHDPVRLTTIQALTVGVGCGLAGFALGGYDFPASAVAAAAFTGVLATAVAFLLMVVAQQTVSPARAALVLLLEPVFAALLSTLRGEGLGAAGVVGGALILLAVVLDEVLPRRTPLTGTPADRR
jgi:drug/metabolite transporter (DMT)-like permease